MTINKVWKWLTTCRARRRNEDERAKLRKAGGRDRETGAPFRIPVGTEVKWKVESDTNRSGVRLTSLPASGWTRTPSYGRPDARRRQDERRNARTDLPEPITAGQTCLPCPFIYLLYIRFKVGITSHLIFAYYGAGEETIATSTASNLCNLISWTKKIFYPAGALFLKYMIS